MTTEPVQTSAPSFPDLSSTPANPHEAQVALDALRNERLAGRVDQGSYLARCEYLHRVIAGEQIAAPNLYPTMEERLAQQYEESMKPPAELQDYHVSIEGDDSDDVRLATHTAIATAFQAAGIPAMHGRVIVDEANRLARQLQSAEDSKLQVDRVAQQLRERWGAEFDERMALIDDLLDAMADANPVVERIIETRPWLIAGSLMSIDMLDRVAQFRASRK